MTYYRRTQSDGTTMCECCNTSTGEIGTCGVDPVTNSCPATETTQNEGGSGSTVVDSGAFTFSLGLLSAGEWGFGLNYQSGSGLQSLLGAGFGFPQYIHLTQEANGDVILHSGVHTTERFVWTGSRYSAQDNNTRATLTRSSVGEDHFRILASNGTVTTFFGFDGTDTPGRIQSICGRNGRAMEYTWAAAGSQVQLQSVTDTFGRSVTYSYFGPEHNYQLRQIEDALGRKLTFQYDSSHRLVAVITPSITRAADGVGLPGGTAYVFQYDVNNPREDRQDDLIRIFYPNQTQGFVSADRSVDVEQVYAGAQERYFVEYGQDPTDADHYGRVIRETVGDPNGGPGGTWSFLYVSDPLQLPANEVDPTDPITHRTVVTDRNGNQVIHDYNAARMSVRREEIATRTKLSVPSLSLASSYVTWTKFNAHNQPLLVVRPEGDSTEYQYDDGTVAGWSGLNERRIGLLRCLTRRPGNSLNLNNPTRSGSNGQSELTQRFFYEPLFNAQCAVIEHRGNPIDGSTYFTPPNGGTPPSDADRSRYAAITYFDYQKNVAATVSGNSSLQTLLGLTAQELSDLVAQVDADMKAGGLPAGFEMDLGDINGDGTGDGAASGLDASTILGHVIKIKHPAVRQLVENASGDPWAWATQERVELFTNNLRGQTTTHTDPEGNLTVYVRYGENDPEGDGRFVSTTLGTKQYGQLKEVHVDADPDDVMTLVGADGDLADFVSGKITRTNTPGVYQDLVTRYQGTAGSGGCTTCGYDALGNILSQSDPRGFTTTYDRDELGRVYRTTSPAPYNYRSETWYDANGNVIRVDVEDKLVQFASDDPADPAYATFEPTGSGYVTHVPTKAGPGGTIRPGWFVNRYSFDLLDHKVQDDLDATGSADDRLATGYEYDPNGNLIKVTKPEGNIVEYDYDERDLRIATRTGYVADSVAGAVTVSVFDRNGQLIDAIGTVDRLGGAGATTLTAVIEDAFHSGQPLSHVGTWDLENTYDGFARVIAARDAVGNVTETTHDPDGRQVATVQKGPAGGASPTDRTGADNVTLASGSVRYDEAGRAYETQQDVLLNTGIDGGNPTHTLPSARSVTHTGGGLAANSTANDHTATVTLTAGESSYVLARSVFDRAGRVSLSAADNGALTRYEYDGASRAISVTDPVGNVVETQYDAGGNAIRTTRTEVAAIADPPEGLVDETFESFACYDALGRLVVAGSQGTDGSLSTTVNPWPADSQTLLVRVGYDSRSNRTVVIDAKGNTALTVFDAAGRATESVQHLRANGQAGPPEDGTTFQADGDSSIRTVSLFDANGRLVELIDDRGGTTLYAYDTLDRQLSLTFHDGSTRTTTYNAASDVTQYVDENGSEFTFTLDALGRKTAVAITPAAGVVGTTAQAFQYDGLSRMTFSRDDAGSNADASFFFDSLGRSVEEKQTFHDDDRYVTHSAFASLAAGGFTFPNGRAVAYTTDDLYRRTQISEGASALATWSFFGPARVAEVKLGNGLILTHMNNARTRSAVQDGVASPAWGDQSSDRLGYDGAGRMIAKRFLDATAGAGGYSSTSSLVGFTTQFDKASNKLYERHLHAENRSHLYPAQDSLGRLGQVQRGTLSQAGDGTVSVSSPITLPGTDTDRTYTLDGLGNWRRTAHTPVGGAETTEVRQHNPLNQITRFGTTDVLYDHGDNAADPDPEIAARGNGNIVNDGTRRYVYDAFNRLKEVTRKSDAALLATYTYDSLGRRIRKEIADLGGGLGGLTGDIPAGTTDYVYGGIQCVEERNPFGGGGSTDTAIRHYVWGLYVDELIQQRDLGSPDVDYYPLADLLYRTHALTDSAKAIVEAYDYDAYGNTAIFTAAGLDSTWFTDDDAPADPPDPACRYLFTGREYDSETGIYWYRMRYYLPQLGRFLSREPLGYRESIHLYQYVMNMPVVYLDPNGLEKTILDKDILDKEEKCERQYQDELKALRSWYDDEVMNNRDPKTDTELNDEYMTRFKALNEKLAQCKREILKPVIESRLPCCNGDPKKKYDPQTHACCGGEVYKLDPERCCTGDEKTGDWGFWVRGWQKSGKFTSLEDCIKKATQSDGILIPGAGPEKMRTALLSPGFSRLAMIRFPLGKGLGRGGGAIRYALAIYACIRRKCENSAPPKPSGDPADRHIA